MNKQELINQLKQINEDIMNIDLYDILYKIKKENITYDKTGDNELYDTLSNIKHSLRHNKLILVDIDKHLYGMSKQDMTENEEFIAMLTFTNYYFSNIVLEISSPRLYEVKDINKVEDFVRQIKSLIKIIENNINRYKTKKGSIKDNEASDTNKNTQAENN